VADQDEHAGPGRGKYSKVGIKREEFQVFVKPVGGVCNLRCSYCYYLEKKNIYPGSQLKMSDEVLEMYILQHLEATSEDSVMFSWHGGEPLLAGIEFYRKVVSLQKQYASGRKILNGIQTNGTLLDAEWCRFLAEERFVIGLSIDGPGRLHNIHRTTTGGIGSFAKVMNGYGLLRQYGINPEILCVVSSTNARYPLEVYSFFRKLGAEFITFLPLVERSDEHEGVTERTVLPLEFGKFLSVIFDRWVENDIGTMKVQIFEEAARIAFRQDHTLCIFKRECGGVPVLEHNGDFYSCDHYVDEKHLLGNISNKSVSELINSEDQFRFGLAKKDTLPQYCVDCPVRDMCNGECPKNRFISTPDGEPGLNYLCEGYRHFFNHCKPFVEALSQVWNNT
jgi:uncharacterized protein